MNEQQQALVDRLNEAAIDTRRFLKLNDEKAAFEKDWPNHLYTPEEISDYPYWGICGKDGLVLLDADKVTMDHILRDILPPTFEVKSPRRGLTHFYVVVEGQQVENKTLHLDGEEEGSGEIRAQNYYLVAPGTEIHYRDLRTSEPKTGRYIITQNRPIAKISYDCFMEKIKPYLGSNPKQPITFEQMRNGVKKGTRHQQGIKYATFLIGVKEFDDITTLHELREWNKHNNPPMSEADLKRMVENALGYVSTNPRNTDQPARLEEVKETFQKWLFIGEDHEVLDVVLACACDRKLKGDPLWLFLISPSGGTKTEFVRSLQNSDIYSLDSLTPHTLISGKVERNEETGELEPVLGILPDIDGKVLVIKDFTVILNKRREDRDEIFSQFRGLYDGYIEFAFGTNSKPIRIKAQIGLIAACTPAIDAYSKLYLQLGERFLKIRHHPDSDKATTKALSNLGKEEEMRLELSEATERLLKHLKGETVKPISQKYLSEIKHLAQSVAILRTPVSISFWKFEVNEAALPIVEYPTRLAKQLLKLSYALALVRGKIEVEKEELQTVKRVARDTCVPNRIRILEHLKNETDTHTTRDIAEKSSIPLATCWRELKEMEYLGVLDYEETQVPTGTYGPLRHTPEKDGWRLKNAKLRNVLGCFTDVPLEDISEKGNALGDTSETEGTAEREPYFNNCYFCQKPIFEPNSVTDDFTEHKPAHKSCYDSNQAMLRAKEDRGEIGEAF